MVNESLLLSLLRDLLTKKGIAWEEKKMFGGICFLVDRKMCFGTTKGKFLVRVDPEEFDSLLENSNSEPMIHGSRIMKGYLYINPEDYQTNERLEFWVTKCLEFNPIANASKK